MCVCRAGSVWPERQGTPDHSRSGHTKSRATLRPCARLFATLQRGRPLGHVAGGQKLNVQWLEMNTQPMHTRKRRPTCDHRGSATTLEGILAWATSEGRGVHICRHQRIRLIPPRASAMALPPSCTCRTHRTDNFFTLRNSDCQALSVFCLRCDSVACT